MEAGGCSKCEGILVQDPDAPGTPLVVTLLWGNPGPSVGRVGNNMVSPEGLSWPLEAFLFLGLVEE